MIILRILHELPKRVLWNPVFLAYLAAKTPGRLAHFQALYRSPSLLFLTPN